MVPAKKKSPELQAPPERWQFEGNGRMVLETKIRPEKGFSKNISV